MTRLLRTAWQRITLQRNTEPAAKPALPIAVDRCEKCWAMPGRPHELSCDEVSIDLFRAYLGGAR